MDRRAFIGQSMKFGAGTALAGFLSGCIGSTQDMDSNPDSNEDALQKASSPDFPSNRAEIEKFCSQFTPGHIAQFGYVVPGIDSPDLDAAIAFWGRTRGIGPFCVLRPPPSGRAFKKAQSFATTQNGGQTQFAPDTNPNIELGLAQVADNAQVEVILQRDLDPTTAYRKVYPTASQGGFHHACIVSNDIAADLRKLVQIGVKNGLQFDTVFADIIGKVLYFDARKLTQLGCHFEITQDTKILPTIAPIYSAIYHLGRKLGPFGKGMSNPPLWLRAYIDFEKLSQTNILFEAESLAKLGATALLLATKTGWVP